MLTAESRIITDTWAEVTAEQIRNFAYVGKHRSGITAWHGMHVSHVPWHARDGRYQEATEALVGAL